MSNDLVIHAVCPWCEIKIELIDKSNLGRNSMIEVFHHMVKDHFKEYDRWLDDNPQVVEMIPKTKVIFSNG